MRTKENFTLCGIAKLLINIQLSREVFLCDSRLLAARLVLIDLHMQKEKKERNEIITKFVEMSHVVLLVEVL